MRSSNESGSGENGLHEAADARHNLTRPRPAVSRPDAEPVGLHHLPGAAGSVPRPGGMLITFILLPLAFLGWATGGIGAIILGTRSTGAGASDRRSAAVVGIVPGVAGL